MQDLEDTTGSWELYGQEDEKRYPSLQADFFNRAAAPLTRRSSLLAFTFVGELDSHDPVVQILPALSAISSLVPWKGLDALSGSLQTWSS